MESQLAMPQTHLTHARSSSICRITNQYLKFADHCEDGPERPRKAPGINLALVWFPFSFPPSTEASGLSVYYVRLGSRQLTPLPTLSRSSQPEETGNGWLLATRESRCQMCPVIRKILQFWHSLRAERQKQPIMEGESSTQAVPEASNHRHSLLHGGCGGPGGVGHGLCSSGPVFF